MRVILAILGGIAVLTGVLWTLQGLGLVGGSVMSGDSTWAIIGPIVAVVGMLVFLFGMRKRHE
ncbi:MAG TPA: hypothetical protein VF163_16940 [Micromonosporaceae bacterium]